MRLNKFILPILFLILVVDTTKVIAQEETSNKGKIYAFWGWNRGWYTNSDIHFTGNNYDFTLNDVEAKDKPLPFNFNNYFGLTNISLPQTNLRIGYFITDKIDISFGDDHMKYVMVSVQETEISGNINDGTIYDGNYNNNDFIINKSFLKYEHTDGLNYLNFEITYNDDLAKTLKFNLNPNKIQLNTLFGFGVGALMPKSNVTLWNNNRNDDFHFAGYGFAGKAGLNVTFFNYFFLRSEYKVGFIDMPDVRTSPDVADKASQHFFFRQFNFCLGFAFNPFN
jgi:hypothetical protein